MAYWYHNIVRTYIIVISKIFSDINVKRLDDDDNEIKNIKVPLIYASKNKISYMLTQKDDVGASSLILPVIGFIITGLQYDPVRKMNSLNTINVEDGKYMFEGIPYNFNFEVTVRTKYQNDFWQILEQILYFFKPDLNFDVKELPYLNFIRDVNIVLNDVSLENELELTREEESFRNFQATLSLTLKGFIYPSDLPESLIEHIDVNFQNEQDKIIANISHDWHDPNIVTTITEN